MKISNAISGLFSAEGRKHNRQIDRSVVRDFEIEDFTGVWYEIARMDNDRVRNSSHVTMTFIMDGEGEVSLVTEEYNNPKGVFEKTRSRVAVPDAERPACMKVSGFHLVNREMNVLEVDEDYNFALLGGRSADALRILSRAPFIPEDDLRYLIARALERGYDISNLVFPEHSTVLSQEEVLALAV